MSASEALYLRPETKLQPLVCGWPAWSHLVAPATCAMNLAFRQIPYLKSFVANPTVHAAAARNPALLGGPFVCLPTSEVPAVRRLLGEISERCERLIGFARQLKDLDEKLQSGASGFSLDAFSREMPAALAGFLELAYDLNNHPHIKVIEPLLYEHFRPSALQSIALEAIDDTERSFFMSTPLMQSVSRLFLEMPFDDPRIDALAASRVEPRPIEDLQQLLGVKAEQEALFRGLFSSEPPQRVQPRFADAGVRVRYFGHACLLIQSAACAVLVDPICAWRRDTTEATLTFDDLPDFIDYVVVTHSHQDHFVLETLLQLRHRIGTVVVPRNARGNLADPSLKMILKQLGFARVTDLEPFDSIPIADGEILSLPFIGEHAGLDIMSKQCLMIAMSGRRLLLLADSDGVEAELYSHIARRVGPLDALFIGMECHGAPLTWLYGCLLTRPVSRRDDDSRRLSGSDCERAWSLLQRLSCDRVFVYAMGQERWMRHLMGLAYAPDSVQLLEAGKFIERCRAAGKQAERLHGCREFLF